MKIIRFSSLLFLLSNSSFSCSVLQNSFVHVTERKDTKHSFNFNDDDFCPWEFFRLFAVSFYDASLNLLLHWVRTNQQSLKSLAIISTECETNARVDGTT